MVFATCPTTFSTVARCVTLCNVSCDLSRNGAAIQLARNITQCDSALSQSFLRPPKKLVVAIERKIRLHWEVNARNQCYLYENIPFASYSFSTICYFRMIAVFESVLRATYSGWSDSLIGPVFQ